MRCNWGVGGRYFQPSEAFAEYVRCFVCVRSLTLHVTDVHQLGDALRDTGKAPADRDVTTRAVVRWVVEDHRPFSIVSTPAFRRLFQKLTQSNGTPPCRQTLRDRATVLARRIRERIKDELKTVECAAVSTDGWLSPTTQEYACVVVHYFDKDWRLKYRCIGVSELKGDSSSAHVRTVIESILSEYKLKPSAVTCDQGKNFANAIDEMGAERLICAAHNINLCVNDMTKPAFTRFEEGVQEKEQYVRKCAHNSV